MGEIHESVCNVGAAGFGEYVVHEAYELEGRRAYGATLGDLVCVHRQFFFRGFEASANGDSYRVALLRQDACGGRFIWYFDVFHRRRFGELVARCFCVLNGVSCVEGVWYFPFLG